MLYSSFKSIVIYGVSAGIKPSIVNKQLNNLET